MVSKQPVQPRLSAAVLDLRESPAGSGFEVFMVRRHIRSDFVPDVFVFPGGTVQDGDRSAEVSPGVCVPFTASLGTGVRMAAIRELFEEAGVLLALRDGAMIDINAATSQRLAEYREQLQNKAISPAEMSAVEDLVFATDALIPCSHWITPVAFPKRFDTHFFAVEHPAGQIADYDDKETTDGVWIAPVAALHLYHQQQFPLVFATVHQLQELADFTNLQEYLTFWRSRTPQVIMPRVVEHHGIENILMPGEPDPQ